MAGGIGRARAPTTRWSSASMVRDEPLLRSLGLESEGTKIDFQTGSNSYLYGTRFITYLRPRYGPEKVIEWVARRPGSRAYFAAQFEQVYGVPLGRRGATGSSVEHEFQQANLDGDPRSTRRRRHATSPPALGVGLARVHRPRRAEGSTPAFTTRATSRTSARSTSRPARSSKIRDVKGPII